MLTDVQTPLLGTPLVPLKHFSSTCGMRILIERKLLLRAQVPDSEATWCAPLRRSFCVAWLGKEESDEEDEEVGGSGRKR